MASLAPPVERTLLVAKVEVSVDYLGRRYALTSNEFADGTVDPRGFVDIESFAVEDGIPVWRYALADALLEQRIFMAPGANVSYLTLELTRASAAARIELKPLAAYRGMHAHEQGGRAFAVEARAAGCTVRAFEGARPFHLELERGRFTARRTSGTGNSSTARKRLAGLDALEDLFVPGVFRAEIAARHAAHVHGERGASRRPPEPVRVARALLERSRASRAALPAGAPAWIETLATASDQFLVRRGDAAAGSYSIIAGFPWFADWGRDTMIALPGLATVLGTLRHRRRAFCAPSRDSWTGACCRTASRTRAPRPSTTPPMPRSGCSRRSAIISRRSAIRSSRASCFPVVKSIIQSHVQGTRYGIGVDPADGLLRAGEPGIQLTWMDAKHGDQVFTPRIGKPVEINALWLNALYVAARLADRVGDTEEKRNCDALLVRATASFRRFWNPELNCLYDVIDVDGGIRHRCRHPSQSAVRRSRCPTRRSRRTRCAPWSIAVPASC